MAQPWCMEKEILCIVLFLQSNCNCGYFSHTSFVNFFKGNIFLFFFSLKYYNIKNSSEVIYDHVLKCTGIRIECIKYESGTKSKKNFLNLEK